jgi:hypothetical protein
VAKVAKVANFNKNPLKIKELFLPLLYFKSGSKTHESGKKKA